MKDGCGLEDLGWEQARRWATAREQREVKFILVTAHIAGMRTSCPSWGEVHATDDLIESSFKPLMNDLFYR